MRVIRGWIVCAGVAWASVAPAAPKAGAPAAPKVSAQALYNAAQAQYGNGDYPRALSLIDQGLALAPKNLDLLWLKATMLLELRKYSEALVAYNALLAAGVTGYRGQQAVQIAQKLRAVPSTFLEVTITNGPATVYLDSKALGALCPPGPSCKQAVPPNQYTVIAERPDFKRWTGPVTVKSNDTTRLSITLIEEPSTLTVQVAPAEARVTVDGAPYDPAAKLAAGPHEVVIALDGYAEERRRVVAQLGKPIQLDVALMPLVPVHVEPLGAVLRLGGKPVAPQDGRIPLPPGGHRLVASSPGYDERRIEIPAERGPDYEIVVKLDRHVDPPPPPPPPPPTGRRKLALATGVAGLVALGAGVALGVSAHHLDDDAYALCPSPAEPCADAAEATDLNARARLRALQANVAYGAAGGAAIAAAVLWLTGGAAERRPVAGASRLTAPRAPRASLTPRLGAVSGLDLSVRF
jgi:hypothetical protein